MLRLASGAVLAAIGAAALLAGCGSSAPDEPKPFAVDERTGKVGRVSLGDSRAQVIAAMGKPGDENSGGPYTPLGEWYEDIGGPPHISVPGPGDILRYDHLAALLISGRVYSIIVTDEARTRAGPGIGDSLSTVRKRSPTRTAASWAPSREL